MEEMCELPHTSLAVQKMGNAPAVVNKFWLGPFQSLCKRCHDSTKRLVETLEFRADVGIDGWPLDPNHIIRRIRRGKAGHLYAAVETPGRCQPRERLLCGEQPVE